MITSEELRVSALTASAKRGKWVARRRIFWRWFSWISWRYVLPVIGFFTVLASLVCLVFWLYLGHDAAYVAAQKWVQQEFGSFQTDIQSNSNSNSINKNTSQNDMNLQKRPSLEPVSPHYNIGETTLDLKLDRHLVLKVAPKNL